MDSICREHKDFAFFMKKLRQTEVPDTFFGERIIGY